MMTMMMQRLCRDFANGADIVKGKLDEHGQPVLCHYRSVCIFVW